jgi:hypothetical protein
MTFYAVVTCIARISSSMERVTFTCEVWEVIRNWVNRKCSARMTGCQCRSESNIGVAETVGVSRTGQEHWLSSSECNNASSIFWEVESKPVFTASWDQKQWLWFWQVIVDWDTAAWKWTNIEMFYLACKLCCIFMCEFNMKIISTLKMKMMMKMIVNACTRRNCWRIKIVGNMQ